MNWDETKHQQWIDAVINEGFLRLHMINGQWIHWLAAGGFDSEMCVMMPAQ